MKNMEIYNFLLIWGALYINSLEAIIMLV